MPASTTASILEGVYKRRQPGYSPHPALLRAKQGPLLSGIGDGGSPISRKINGSVSQFESVNAGKPNLAWATLDLKREDIAAGVKGLPKWARPAFLQEVPPRLEDCRQRLVAAERELRQLEVAAAAEESRQWEVPMHDSIHLPPLVGKKAAAYVHLSPGAQSMLYPRTQNSSVEPAPEPPMQEPQESGHFPHGFGVNGDEEELTLHLDALEEQMEKLDAKWSHVDDSRRRNVRAKSRLQASLEESEAVGRSLKSDLSRTTAVLHETKKLAEDLRDHLGVFEAENAELRTYLQASQAQEVKLAGEAAVLAAQVAATKSDLEVLSEQFHLLQEIKEVLERELLEAQTAREEQKSSFEKELQALLAEQAEKDEQAARELEEQKQLLEKQITELEDSQVAQEQESANALKEQRELYERLQESKEKAVTDQHQDYRRQMEKTVHDLKALQEAKHAASAKLIEEQRWKHQKELKILEDAQKAKHEEDRHAHDKLIKQLHDSEAFKEAESTKRMEALQADLDKHKLLLTEASHKLAASPADMEAAAAEAQKKVEATAAEAKQRIEAERKEHEERHLQIQAAQAARYENQLRELEAAQASREQALMQQLEQAKAAAPLVEAVSAAVPQVSPEAIAAVALEGLEELITANGSLQLVFMTEGPLQGTPRGLLKSLRPAACRVDQGTFELRLQRLRADGRPSLVPLKNVMSFNVCDTREDGWFGDLAGELALDIEVERETCDGRRTPSRIRILAPGEGAAALLAKICAEDRIGPGSLLDEEGSSQMGR